MHFHTPHALQPFWNLAAASMQTQALEQALELGLFELLHQAASATAVAAQLELKLTATQLWLDLLWSMDLLIRHAQAAEPTAYHYSTSALARQYFSRDADQYCAQAWQYRARALARFSSQWESLLRNGFAAQSEAAPVGSWAEAARVQIGQEQRAITGPAVLRMLKMLPTLPPTGRLLDIGGGPGHVGIALAQQWPGWHGVVCDQYETAVVAQENIDAAGLSERLHALGCDLNTQAIGSGFDLIWCSAVLHFMRDPQATMSKAAGALKPGGWLLLAHAEQTDDPRQAAEVLPFYGTVAMRGHWLPRTGELAQMLAQAGLVEIQSLGRLDFPMAPVWLHIARRP